MITQGRWVTKRSHHGYSYRVWEKPMPRIPLEVLDCSFYVYRSVIDANEGKQTGGCGFLVQVPSVHPGWKEVFNSDASIYGGDNTGNYGTTLSVQNGAINAIVPAHGFVVLQKVS